MLFSSFFQCETLCPLLHIRWCLICLPTYACNLLEFLCYIFLLIVFSLSKITSTYSEDAYLTEWTIYYIFLEMYKVTMFGHCCGQHNYTSSQTMLSNLTARQGWEVVMENTLRACGCIYGQKTYSQKDVVRPFFYLYHSKKFPIKSSNIFMNNQLRYLGDIIIFYVDSFNLIFSWLHLF